MLHENSEGPPKTEANSFDYLLFSKRQRILKDKLPKDLAISLLPDVKILENSLSGKDVLGQAIKDAYRPSSEAWYFYAHTDQEGKLMQRTMPRNFKIAGQIYQIAKDHYLRVARERDENPQDFALYYDTALTITVASKIIEIAELEYSDAAGDVLQHWLTRSNQPDDLEGDINNYLKGRNAASSAKKLLRGDPTFSRNSGTLMKRFETAVKDPEYKDPLLAPFKDILSPLQPEFVENGGRFARTLYSKLDHHERNAISLGLRD